MADETSQEEPSMEEILASIRRIISEDGEEEEKPEAAQAKAVEESAPAADGASADAAPAEALEPAGAGDEVLELTAEVDEDGNVVEAQAPEQAAPVTEASQPAAEPIAEPTVQPTSAPETPEADAPLMRNVTEDTAAGAFAALASQLGPGRTADGNAQQITPAGRTIEDHVLEMLRPMLREWLDKHLPQMVQRLVQREIDRVIHRSDLV